MSTEGAARPLRRRRRLARDPILAVLAQNEVGLGHWGRGRRRWRRGLRLFNLPSEAASIVAVALKHAVLSLPLVVLAVEIFARRRGIANGRTAARGRRQHRPLFGVSFHHPH